MSKIIKKKIQKSMPVLLIFTLISMSVAGFFFNFEVAVKKFSISDGIKFGWKMLSAEAQNDTASTTVRVRNAPPAFSVAASESPVSTSTSPVNVGASISFTGTAHDNEANNYYLLICASAGASPGAGGSAPSCTGTQYCVSGATASDVQASCTLPAVDAGASETRDWYAYACDNHATEAACSLVNQGSNPGIADGSSPFFVNHAPGFTALSTTDDNKAPGGTFQITATVSDPDVLGGADKKVLTVCDTNVWDIVTGCAGNTLCTASSTANSISCNYTDTAPTPDQAYTYYGFVKDWHDMASAANSRSSNYTIINVAPTVSFGAGDFNNGNTIVLNLKTASDKRVWATSTNVVDQNGCDDITAATATVYISSSTVAVNANQCAPNDNNCYQVGTGNCTMSDCPVGGNTDAAATMACYFDLKAFAIPTDNSTGNPYNPEKWLVAIDAFDNNNANGVGTTSMAVGVDVQSNTALEVNETTIPYGTIIAGQDSGAYNATTTIINYGNTPLSNDLSGTDMQRSGGGGYISTVQQTFDLVNFTYPGANTLPATTSPASSLTLAIARPTSNTNVTDDIYWGIAIPSGLLSGDYAGQNTFTATLNSSGNWN